MGSSITRLLLENVQPRTGRRGWHGGPTPLGALRGVDAILASWRPGRGRKTIWELALHVAYWKYAVRRRLEGGEGPGFDRHPADWPHPPTPADARAWAADIALLRTEHERLIATIARVPAVKLDRVPPGGKRWTCGELIVGIAQHDAHHTGQIQLIKRLREANR